MQAGGQKCSDQKVSLNKPLRKIISKVREDEEWLFSIEFHFADGSVQYVGRIHKEEPDQIKIATSMNRWLTLRRPPPVPNNGRQMKFELTDEEELIGVEMAYGGGFLFGVRFLKWKQAKPSLTMRVNQ